MPDESLLPELWCEFFYWGLQSETMYGLVLTSLCGPSYGVGFFPLDKQNVTIDGLSFRVQNVPTKIIYVFLLCSKLCSQFGSDMSRAETIDGHVG